MTGLWRAATLWAVTYPSEPANSEYPAPPDPSGGWYQPAPQHQAPYYQAPPPVPPRRGLSTGAILGIVAGIVAVLCVGAAVALVLVPAPDDTPRSTADGTGIGTPAPYDTSQPIEAATSAPASPPAAAGPLTSFRDGTYEVGAGAGQIAPGKYKTTVPSDSGGCYWERLSGTGGSFDEIIANGNAGKNTPVIVTIATGDKAFKAERCGTWSKA